MEHFSALSICVLGCPFSLLVQMLLTEAAWHLHCYHRFY